MSNLLFKAMPTAEVRYFQSGGADANGQTPEQHISDGDGVPCRHCLQDVEKGEAYLILAYRPFSTTQPYAETGPIFLHADQCERAAEARHGPPMLAKRKAHLIKGYGSNDRIVHGTGQVVPSAGLETAASEILARPDVAYVHVRSALNNCYTCRIDRASAAT
jgi:hypothetical protein